MLGVYVIGAPVWERLASRVRWWSFQKGPRVASGDSNHLETIWDQTQNHYSINGQMSRNLLNQCLIRTDITFQQCEAALQENDLPRAAKYLAKQIIEHQILFRDVPDDSPLVLMAVRSMLLPTNPEAPATDLGQLEKLTLEMIPILEPNFSPENHQWQQCANRLRMWLASVGR